MQHKKPDDELTFIQNANAGALAGALTTFLAVPSERIKCLLQVQTASATKYRGPMDVLKKLYSDGGFKSIYRGTGATLLRG
jgi:solute carrier family 25 carnitine/acylcarnitine transporter 20/29